MVGYLRRIATKYLITTQRLRISRGIVSKKVQETRLERVQNVNYEQGVLDRVLGVGTVDFDTAGTDDSEFRFEWVNDPEQVVRAVDQAVEEARAAASERRARSRGVLALQVAGAIRASARRRGSRRRGPSGPWRRPREPPT